MYSHTYICREREGHIHTYLSIYLSIDLSIDRVEGSAPATRSPHTMVS